MRRVRLLSAGTIVMSVIAAGTAQGEEDSGDLARCYAGAGTAYMYCTSHGYPIGACSESHTWTVTQCAIQYPY